jgi:cyclohexanone monooxygenase
VDGAQSLFEMTRVNAMSDKDSEILDVVVIGGGFAGMYAVHRLRQENLSILAFDEAADVGGVWYWNRYPGAQCDVDSRDYSYSFSPELQQQWEWSLRNARQPEILAYANHVADRFDLRRSYRFNTRIASARFDESMQLWVLETQMGEVFRCRFCVMATGPLSAPRTPDIPGFETFKGRVIHTARWPHEPVDFSGRRVGIIGTGSSGIQAIPFLAQAAKHLYVFQRTPQFALPAQNYQRSRVAERTFRKSYQDYREYLSDTFSGYHVDIEPGESAKTADPEERKKVFEVSWGRGLNALMRSYKDLLTDLDSNALAAQFVRDKIGQIVKDPEVARKLMPKDYPIGAKRLCLEDNYWETFNRDNVTLVDVRESPFTKVTENAIETTSGRYEIDDLVLATGFDALTGALTSMDIRGRNNLSLAAKWKDGARSYLGIAVAGFPNLFTVSGPGSPSVFANLILASEQHVDWIAECISSLRRNHIKTIEAQEQAEAEWAVEVAAVADKTLIPLANSWWIGANVPGKPRVFLPYLGGFPAYKQKCKEVVEKGYAGFTLSK